MTDRDDIEAFDAIAARKRALPDPIRTRLSALEGRAERLNGGFTMVHLYASKYGWKTSCNIAAMVRGMPDEYFPTADAAIDFFEAALNAYEDRDGNLARTLGVECVG